MLNNPTYRVSPRPINVYIRDTTNTIIASGAYTSPGSYSFTFTPSSSNSDYTLEYYVIDASGLCSFTVDNILITSPSTTYITVCDTLHAGDYRYSFQGQEHDDEIKGKGNSINYTYRMHDPRLGRFFAVDPLAEEFPWNSSYAFSENNVINAVELEGLEKVYVYNKWIDGKGNEQTKFSHVYTDNNLTENINQVNYYNAYGKVEKTKYESIINKNKVTLSSTADHTQVYTFMKSTEFATMTPTEIKVHNSLSKDVTYYPPGEGKPAPLPIRLLVKVSPGLSQVDAGVTLFTGKDMMSPQRGEVTGTWDRYISPIMGLISGAYGLLGGTSKAVKAVDATLTGYGVKDEIGATIEDNKIKNDNSNTSGTGN